MKRDAKKEKKKRVSIINIATANSRSLEPKTISLIDLINECELTAVVVTETWLKKQARDKINEEFENGNGFGMLSYLRPGVRRGGGVSIVFDRSKINLEENKFGKDGCEIISAVGSCTGEKRKIVIYGIYLPPNLSKPKSDRACEIINDNITEMKTKYESPVIVIAGDFNQYDIRSCYVDHPDIIIENTPPSRKEK